MQRSDKPGDSCRWSSRAGLLRFARNHGLRRCAMTQTVRTFWQSGVPSLYQRLALKSFADRGHRVEVFSYDPSLDLPRFVVVRDAADVLPPERVLRFLPEHGRFVVNIDLFRYALLAKFGGWWIDPDVVLLGDLPADEIFLAGPDEFGALSLAVLRLPPQHPVAMIAEEVAAANAASIESWPNAGALFLAELAERHGLSSLCHNHAKVAPVSRIDLPKLFDPAQTQALVDSLKAAPFLDLHYDAWLRAGVPVHASPPDGSLLQSPVAATRPRQRRSGPNELWQFGATVRADARRGGKAHALADVRANAAYAKVQFDNTFERVGLLRRQTVEWLGNSVLFPREFHGPQDGVTFFDAAGGGIITVGNVGCARVSRRRCYCWYPHRHCHVFRDGSRADLGSAAAAVRTNAARTDQSRADIRVCARRHRQRRLRGGDRRARAAAVLQSESVAGEVRARHALLPHGLLRNGEALFPRSPAGPQSQSGHARAHRNLSARRGEAAAAEPLLRLLQHRRALPEQSELRAVERRHSPRRPGFRAAADGPAQERLELVRHPRPEPRLRPAEPARRYVRDPLRRLRDAPVPGEGCRRRTVRPELGTAAGAGAGVLAGRVGQAVHRRRPGLDRRLVLSRNRRRRRVVHPAGDAAR